MDNNTTKLPPYIKSTRSNPLIHKEGLSTLTKANKKSSLQDQSTETLILWPIHFSLARPLGYALGKPLKKLEQISFLLCFHMQTHFDIISDNKTLIFRLLSLLGISCHNGEQQFSMTILAFHLSLLGISHHIEIYTNGPCARKTACSSAEVKIIHNSINRVR